MFYLKWKSCFQQYVYYAAVQCGGGGGDGGGGGAAVKLCSTMRAKKIDLKT